MDRVLGIAKGIGIFLGIIILLLIFTGNITDAVNITKGVGGGLLTAGQRVAQFISALFS